MKPNLHILPTLLSIALLGACVGPSPSANTRYNAPTTRPNDSNRNTAGLRPRNFEPGQFRTWVDSDPVYRLLPGDQLNVFVYSAPELNQTLIVGPDGRVSMPLAQPIMAANLTLEELEQRLRNALSSQLVDPELELAPQAFGSQRVFVGGQVGQAGIYELPGQIGTLEAIMMAGGFTDMSKTQKIVLIRRHPSGAPMMKIVDLRALLQQKSVTDMTPLQRGDIIYVPRSTIGNVNLFMRQYIRDSLPINFGLTYAIGRGF